MTAGTYRHFFEDNGQGYSFMVNPHTGQPVTRRLLFVTILQEDSTLADLWDTALLCAGGSEAARIAEEEHLRALLVCKDDNEFRDFMSTAFLLNQMDSPTPPEPQKHRDSSAVSLYPNPSLDKSNGEGRE